MKVLKKYESFEPEEHWEEEIDDDFGLPQVFIKFLIENGVYDLYIKRLKESYSARNMIKKRTDDHNLVAYISWTNIGFWSELDSKWLKKFSYDTHHGYKYKKDKN